MEILKVCKKCQGSTINKKSLNERPMQQTQEYMILKIFSLFQNNLNILSTTFHISDTILTSCRHISKKNLQNSKVGA